MTSRTLSILLFCTYVPLFRSEGLGTVWTILGCCLVPLICVWFPEAMAEATGGNVRASPPGLVWLFGWVTLLIPLMLKLVALYVYS